MMYSVTYRRSCSKGDDHKENVNADEHNGDGSHRKRVDPPPYNLTAPQPFVGRERVLFLVVVGIVDHTKCLQ